jgi:hypothetical protein
MFKWLKVLLTPEEKSEIENAKDYLNNFDSILEQKKRNLDYQHSEEVIDAANLSYQKDIVLPYDENLTKKEKRFILDNSGKTYRKLKYKYDD